MYVAFTCGLSNDVKKAKSWPKRQWQSLSVDPYIWILNKLEACTSHYGYNKNYETKILNMLGKLKHNHVFY